METEVLLRALQEVEKRAERVDEADVIATYVDVDALVNALGARDNGIVYGRRGTGKTHALKYLAETQRAAGNRVIYIDMEQDVGSTEGRYADTSYSLSERATRLVVDVLSIVHTQLLEAAFAGQVDVQIEVLDRMLDHFKEVLVAEEVEAEAQSSSQSSSQSNASLQATVSAKPGLTGSFGSSDSRTVGSNQLVRASGKMRHRVHFGGVSKSMREAILADEAPRFWLLLDEWSGVPIDLQPYLAEMLRKLFFGLPKVTVRIAAIPHRSEWRIAGERGDYIGAEVGAEVFPLLDLDEFVVFPARNRAEQSRRSLSFFRSLLFRHVATALKSMGAGVSLESDQELVSSLFTQSTSLQEVVRAAEGVPRDALSIVGRAGLRAGGSKIAVTHVREAAAQLYTTTKESQLNGVPAARALLDRIISDVISTRKARAFLLAQDDTLHPLIQQLVDDRILHIIKRGYSSQDRPGERYDVLQIDYGCYVHLLGTSAAPQRFLGEDGDDESSFAAVMASVEVPEDDYRAIRRAVLDLPGILGAIEQSPPV